MKLYDSWGEMRISLIQQKIIFSVTVHRSILFSPKLNCLKQTGISLLQCFLIILYLIHCYQKIHSQRTTEKRNLVNFSNRVFTLPLATSAFRAARVCMPG